MRRLPCSLVIRDSLRGARAACREGKTIMSERAYSAVPFADVRITGPFWRERLDTVLSRTIASQHKKLVEMNMIEVAGGEAAAPAADHFLTAQRVHHADLLGLPHRQVDRGGELRARPSAATRHRSADRRDRRRSRASRSCPTATSTAGTSGATRAPLDQPARQPRTL